MLGWRPYGILRGVPRSPQDLTPAVMRIFLDSLTDQPGLRLAQQTGRRVFFGGSSPAPQRFTRPQGGTQTEEVLAVAPLTINARQMIGKRRGTPPGR